VKGVTSEQEHRSKSLVIKEQQGVLFEYREDQEPRTCPFERPTQDHSGEEGWASARKIGTLMCKTGIGTGRREREGTYRGDAGYRASKHGKRLKRQGTHLKAPSTYPEGESHVSGGACDGGEELARLRGEKLLQAELDLRAWGARRGTEISP